MPNLRLFHWRGEEAKPLIDFLRHAGYTVAYPGDKQNGNFKSMKEAAPLAAIIDLTRLPSHGRYVAAAIRGQKSTRSIPIVFLDGEPDKVAKIRTEFPDAVYATRARLIATLKRVKPITDPVVPRQLMDFSTRTAAQKLGITKDLRVALIDPPVDYARVIGKLPAGAILEEDPREPAPLTLWFVHDPDTYRIGLRKMRTLKTRLWILWQRGDRAKKTGVTQMLIRESALAVGLVDYKVCSVNETWSGLLFTRKK